METIKFIREHGVEALKSKHNIIVKDYDDLIVLNYNVCSPKHETIVRECRGLILNKHTLDVVSRSFDRFFNLGEFEHQGFDNCVVYDKIDGSLIKLYNFNNTWYLSTRGTAFAETTAHSGDTFVSLCYKALGIESAEELQERCTHLDPNVTYIGELTCRENRVVTIYDGYIIHLLGARNNITGTYVSGTDACTIGFRPVNSYAFDTIENLITVTNALPDLQEGFVIWKDNTPYLKVKSHAYLVAHQTRGEGLTPKRLARMVLFNEMDEYLAYFPEDTRFFNPYVLAKEKLESECVEIFSKYKSLDIKPFAEQVYKYGYSMALFKTKRNGTDNVLEQLYNLNESKLIDLLISYV